MLRILARGLTGPDADEVESAKLKFQCYAAPGGVRAYHNDSFVGMFFREHHVALIYGRPVVMKMKGLFQQLRRQPDRNGSMSRLSAAHWLGHHKHRRSNGAQKQIN